MARPAGTGIEEHLSLDGRVAAGVEDLAPDHVLNGAHDITPWCLPWRDTGGTRLADAKLLFGDALGRDGCRARKRQRAVAQRVFRVDAERVAPGSPRRRGARPTDRLRLAASLVQRVVGTTARRRGAPRQAIATEAACTASGAARSGSSPTERALRASLVVSMRAGRADGMPSVTLARPFSDFLIVSQLVTTSSAPVRFDVTEHVGMAVHQLVVHGARHVRQVEPAFLVGQPGVEDDLEEQVAQLLLRGGRRPPRRPPAARRRASPGRRAPRSTPRPGAASATHASAPGPRGSALAACP